ncbi:unnamed protein product [Dicrocoelium dendriticum]|nr:unnamed protein product [Dicrocoelium dendriticum]
MAALVDQHRFIYPRKPSRVVHHRVHSIANNDPSVPSNSVPHEESSDDKEDFDRDHADFCHVLSRKLSARVDKHPFVNGGNLQPDIEKLDRAIVIEVVQLPSVNHDGRKILQPSVDDDSEDEDDNVPLSTFVSSRATVQQPASPLVSSSSPPTPIPIPSQESSPPRLCYCTKPAITDDPRWDGQFCSTECLVSECRQAFNLWLHAHQSSV